jgi:hypothetical protein
MTQLTDIVGDLTRHEHIFDLDRHGLGEALLDLAAEAILAQMDSELDSDGQPWPELSEGYAEFKAEHAPGKQMAELWGLMKSLDNLRGVRHIDQDSAQSTFGYDTDQSRDEAFWFQEGFDGVDSLGRKRHQPPRPFYAFNQHAIDEADQYLTRHFDRMV